MDTFICTFIGELAHVEMAFVDELARFSRRLQSISWQSLADGRELRLARDLYGRAQPGHPCLSYSVPLC